MASAPFATSSAVLLAVADQPLTLSRPAKSFMQAHRKDTKEVAQTGACIGREFGYELLAEVSAIQGEALDEALVQLVESGLVFRRGQHREGNYSFKHALMRDASYSSLLKAHRRRVHESIAETLDKQFPDVAAEQPEVLAHHYSEAELNESAVGYWQRAGQRASERSAYLEAIAHLTQGLASLVNLPETPARLQQELDIQVALGPALMNIRGQADPEVARAYARARELCQQAGETPKLFPVLSGL
ncbi:MAG TPA: adenylate/guanylate cyclase domain-containing protein, partial [Myxococcota bacterium]